jgi:hypothetical protein
LQEGEGLYRVWIYYCNIIRSGGLQERADHSIWM